MSGGKRYQSFLMEVPPLLAIADQPADVPVLVVAPARKRRRIPRLPPAVENVEPDDTELFTPEQVVNTNRCEARVWGAGWGGQCQKKKAPECRFCGMHKGDGGPSHGAVDGPIPANKLKSFRTFRLTHGPPPVAVDYF